MPPAAPSLKATAARIALINDNTHVGVVQDPAFKARLRAWRSEVLAATTAAELATLFAEFIDGTEGHASFDAAMRHKRTAALTAFRRHGVTLATIARHVKIYQKDVIEAGRRVWHARLKLSSGGQRRSWKSKDPKRQSAYALGTRDIVADWHERFDARVGRVDGSTVTVQASRLWRAENFVQVNAEVIQQRPGSRSAARRWDQHVGKPLLRGKGFVVLPMAGTRLAAERLEELRSNGIARMGSLQVCAMPATLDR